MLEITFEEQNKVNRMKRTEDSLRDFWDHIKHINIQITGVSEEEKKKGCEKIFEEIIDKIFPNMEKESPRGTKSPIRDKTKKKHTKTHTNQTNKDETQGKNIKGSKGKATSKIQGKSHMLNS